MSEWQPIESAPKDGTSILVYDYEGYQDVTRWADGFTQGWTGHANPLWWMPLPAPPEDEQS